MICIKSMYIHGIISTDTNGVIGGFNVNDYLFQPISLRMAIVLDTQTNGATASWGDVYSTDSFNAHLNPSNTGRFRVLRDYKKVLTRKMVAWDSSVKGAPSIAFNWDVKFPKMDIPIRYTKEDTTGVVGNIMDNNIFIVARAYDGGSDNTLSIDFVRRLRYLDLSA